MVYLLSESDKANVFEIPLSEDFNGGKKGQQVLYSDPDFTVTLEKDGYTFLQEI